MEITGRIIAVLPPQSGVSQRTGQQWASQQFVIQTDERFPQKLLFKVFGMDRLQQWNIQMGETLTVQFTADAHENNGRWYGENTAYNVVRQGQQMQQPMQQGYQQMPPQQSPFPPQQPMVQGQQVQSPFPPQQAQPQQPAPGQAPFPPQPASQPAQQQAAPQNNGLPFQ